MIHPARTMPFADLRGALLHANDSGLVSRQVSSEGLEQYTYTQRCVYDRAWNPVTEMARGIVLDPANDNVVATPFVKFFNHGERDVPLPNMPFETYEKLDGSLIILFHHNGQWRTATKGSFTSVQAQAAKRMLPACNPLMPGYTFLLEFVGPSNRIVLHYPRDELVLLGAYDKEGREVDFEDLRKVALAMDWQRPLIHYYDSFADLVAQQGKLPATQEGFVVRFDNGYRLKIKGDEYCRLHRLISNVTPLAIWDQMRNGADMDAIRRELPEEFWADFDIIRGKLYVAHQLRLAAAQDALSATAGMTDKQIGLSDLHNKSHVFSLRKGQDISESIYKAIRPTGNNLDGYLPSGAMQRIEREAA